MGGLHARKSYQASVRGDPDDGRVRNDMLLRGPLLSGSRGRHDPLRVHNAFPDFHVHDAACGHLYGSRLISSYTRCAA